MNTENTTNTTTETTENTNTENVSTEGAAAKENTPAAKTFTQEEVNALIAKEKARERKKFENKEKTPDPTLETLQKRIDAQNRKLMVSEANRLAMELNFKKERLNAALKLADLTAIEMNEDGEYDIDDLKAKLESVATDYPEFLKAEKKEETNNKTGFFKVGTELKGKTSEDDLKKQIYEGLGLKL